MESAAPIKRRSMLLGVGGVAAAALGAALGRADAMSQAAQHQQAADTVAEPRQETGYRLTEHIRAYYRTTRI
ncbi:MAG: hypothetical protein HIU89_15670 [Proteobacteria bacterium]|nr:hypothetical protein [Pseudomonadota bacterium]